MGFATQSQTVKRLQGQDFNRVFWIVVRPIVILLSSFTPASTRGLRSKLCHYARHSWPNAGRAIPLFNHHQSHTHGKALVATSSFFPM
jgi:hypothetical protein